MQKKRWGVGWNERVRATPPNEFREELKLHLEAETFFMEIYYILLSITHHSFELQLRSGQIFAVKGS